MLQQVRLLKKKSLQNGRLDIVLSLYQDSSRDSLIWLVCRAGGMGEVCICGLVMGEGVREEFHICASTVVFVLCSVLCFMSL